MTYTSVNAFVGWIASIACYVIFLLWAFVPEEGLHSFGIFYYPPKYVAVAAPSLMVVTLILMLMAYIGHNLYITLSPDDMCTIQSPLDTTPEAPTYFVNCGRKEGIPDPGDLDNVHRSFFMANKHFGRRRYR
jgi:hypothetical protein